MLNSIDYKNGEVTYIDALDFLKEDLLQVQYPLNYILDVGWYGNEGWAYENLQGLFKVQIIKDWDWQAPIATYSCRDIVELKENVEKAIDEVDSLCQPINGK